MRENAAGQGMVLLCFLPFPSGTLLPCVHASEMVFEGFKTRQQGKSIINKDSAKKLRTRTQGNREIKNKTNNTEKTGKHWLFVRPGYIYYKKENPPGMVTALKKHFDLAHPLV
jgi:hypothetical protein